jgi:NDP-sugar pyrophosphorylase family protein
MRRGGIRHIACNAHHLRQWIHHAVIGLDQVEVFDEPILLGSAGGLSHVKGRAADPLAVWNGDALAEIPWERFKVEHLRRDADLSWLLVPHDGGPWNPVWLDEEDRILPEGRKGRGPYHFTGAALWSSRALALLDGSYADTKLDILPRLQHHAGIVVELFPWREVGTPDHLIESARELAPDQEGRIPGCYVHPTALPQGDLERCILGPNACPHSAMEDRDALWFEEGGRQVRLPLH